MKVKVEKNRHPSWLSDCFTWTVTDLLGYYNMSIHIFVTVTPDACSSEICRKQMIRNEEKNPMKTERKKKKRKKLRKTEKLLLVLFFILSLTPYSNIVIHIGCQQELMEKRSHQLIRGLCCWSVVCKTKHKVNTIGWSYNLIGLKTVHCRKVNIFSLEIIIGDGRMAILKWWSWKALHFLKQSQLLKSQINYEDFFLFF